MQAAPALPATGLYSGVVSHVRHRPRHHALRYRIFMLLLDLDTVDRTLARLRWLSGRRFAPISFRQTDHGDGGERPLAQQMRERLAAEGLPVDGPIRLLTMPRIFGHAFNPISVYLCHQADGRLAATLYEVSNTFGERHSYLIPVERDADAVIRQTVEKRFYVSPFMDMDLSYRFLLAPPATSVRLVVDVDDERGALLNAVFVGKGQSLTDAHLLAAWASHPLLTLKVVLAIHWEALRLFARGLRVRTRPPLPARSVTVGRSARHVPSDSGEQTHAI